MMIRNVALGLLIVMCSGKTFAKETPVIILDLPGMLGNRLFMVCVGNILAEKMSKATNVTYKCYSPAVDGFPHTYDYIRNKPSNKYSTQKIVRLHDLEIDGIAANHKVRNIFLEGYFQRAYYLENYREKIRNEWLRIDPRLSNIFPRNYDDVVVHIRTHHDPIFLPLSYYEEALSRMTFKQLYVCTDEPTDPYIENFKKYFKKYNPIVRSKRSLQDDMMKAKLSWPDISKINLDDFLFIMSFDRIISSNSTYSWWAAYLSDAREIYMPYSDNKEAQVYGKINEPRFHYIDTKIGK